MDVTLEREQKVLITSKERAQPYWLLYTIEKRATLLSTKKPASAP